MKYYTCVGNTFMFPCWSSCINHIPCITITLVCVLTGGKCRRIPVESWQSITDTQCGGETFTHLQLCSMSEPKQPSGYYHIIHETELQTVVSPRKTDKSHQPIKTAEWAAEADIETVTFLISGGSGRVMIHHLRVTLLIIYSRRKWQTIC